MRKRLTITLLVLVIIVVAGFTFYLSGTLTKPGDAYVIPRYLSYNDKTSKIYLIDSFTSYGNANKTYTTADGQIIDKGTPFFIITMTLRNDYSSDNPAPPPQNQEQTSPADGTAYLYLTTKLYDKDGQVNATNVSTSDFSLTAASGTGLVLSSGKTSSVNIYLATSQTNINKYEINLYFLGDSIPTKNT
ncbi:MAG: hypothetical protein ACM3UL_04615 [Ignavibacteria bacterium]